MEHVCVRSEQSVEENTDPNGTDTRYLYSPSIGGSGPNYLPSLLRTSFVYDSAGAFASGTQYTYDCASGCLSATAIPNIDSRFGSSVLTRGNVTKFERRKTQSQIMFSRKQKT